MRRGREGSPLYGLFFRLVLRRIDAETAHHLGERLLSGLGRVPGALWLAERLLGPRDLGLRVRAMGLEFRSPLGIAAGVDKDGRWYASLAALGFGAIEVGTVTARPQPGNEGKRVARIVASRALFNRLGFPSDGAAAVAPRLAGRRTAAVIGVNVGKTKDVELDDAVADYREAVRALAPQADYLVLNVSSPNTPGLTRMQTVERLDDLIAGVRAELAVSARATPLPLLLKLGPDLADAEIEQIADLALRRELDGIIAVNTTTRAEGVTVSGELAGLMAEGGGVSGPPLRDRSHEVLRLLRRRVGERIAIVSVGGVADAEDVWDRILAGASLVQVYTGFVYGGPLWPHRVNRGLARRLRASPWNSLGEAVGQGAPQEPAERS